MKHVYWIKFMFNQAPPEKFVFEHTEEMWYRLRELGLREPQRYGIIEWMIRE